MRNPALPRTRTVTETEITMDDLPDHTLCDQCTKDANLTRHIREHGKRGTCTLCGHRRARVVRNSSMTNLFKAVVRYHYREPEYNGHWGGDELYQLLDGENPILNTANRRRDDEFYFDSYIHSLIDPVYPPGMDESKGVFLYYGHDQGGRGMYPSSLQESFSQDIEELAQALRGTNYYTLEDAWIDKLKPLAPNISATIPPGRSLYRARIGLREELLKYSYDGSMDYKRVCFPFVGAEIGPPPHPLAKAGRVNRAHIATLYLATSPDTALAEVRPHPGHVVSIGEFRNTVPIKIADFAGVELLPFATTERMIDAFVMLRNIEHAFAMPVLPDEPAGYMLTQFIADVLRRIGFDGITFRSSIAEGTNLVVFDPNTFAYVEGSATARRVTSLVYGVQTPEVELKKQSKKEASYYPINRAFRPK